MELEKKCPECGESIIIDSTEEWPKTGHSELIALLADGIWCTPD